MSNTERIQPSEDDAIFHEIIIGIDQPTERIELEHDLGINNIYYDSENTKVDDIAVIVDEFSDAWSEDPDKVELLYNYYLDLGFPAYMVSTAKQQGLLMSQKNKREQERNV